MMKIGTAIRAHRLQKGLSQGDIEKKTGLLRCYLSRVENGHTVPSLDTLSKIARALDLPITQFFADDSRGPAANLQEALRRGTALPHPDPPLFHQPERQRPQAAAGHGQKVRRHGDA
jgi:transcriptional regulator with XRE-family HTH domain